MTITKHAALLLMTLVVLSGLVSAQKSTTIKAQIPFDFVANGKTMPAGECTIAVDVNGSTLLSIRSGEQRTFAVPNADESSGARKKTALVFHRYGKRYFLVAIEHEGETGYQLPASAPERELLARNVPGQVFRLLASAQ
jgi:hypothetical protein